MNRPIVVSLLVLLVVALVAPTVIARGSRPARTYTDRGEWNGSWMYVSQNEVVALFMRGPADRPEIKVRYQHEVRPEQFETDWSGHASYFFGGRPGVFDLTLQDVSASRLHGTWRREFTLGGSRMTESGSFTMGRSGDGRGLLLDIDELHVTRESPDGAVQERIVRRAWTFRKVSRRVVRWEELPR